MIENKKSKQSVLSFLVFLLIASLLINYQYYKKHHEEKKQFSIFLHDFYYEVEDIVSRLDTLIQEEPTDDRLNSELISLTKHLDILNHMLERVPYYMQEQGGMPNYVGRVSHIINFGSHYDEHYIPPFRSGNILNQKELAFIKAFKARMEEIKSHLELEETGELNTDIDKHIFNNINNILIDRHYKLFLNEYLDLDVNK